MTVSNTSRARLPSSAVVSTAPLMVFLLLSIVHVYETIVPSASCEMLASSVHTCAAVQLHVKSAAGGTLAVLKHGLQEVAGSRLISPKRDDLRPDPEFLAERFERFRVA